MHMYLEVIKEIKEHKLIKDIAKIEEDIIMIDYHLNNCFIKEKEARKFIDKILKEYKEDLEMLYQLIGSQGYSNNNVYYMLYDIGYNLFRIIIIKFFEDKSEEEISKLISNTDQTIYYEIMNHLKVVS